jgi:hypothetical protein
VTVEYRVHLADVARVARAFEILRELLRGEPNYGQRYLVARGLAEGRVENYLHKVTTGELNQLRQVGVIAGRAGEPIVLTPGFLAMVDAPPVASRRIHARDPRRDAINTLRAVLDALALGDAGWPDVESALAPLRDVISRQCCERDTNLDGDCPVHPPEPRRRV